MSGHIFDWQSFAIGFAFAFVGTMQAWRDLVSGEARDGDKSTARRYRRDERPLAYWSLIAVDFIAVLIGVGLVLYSFRNMQP